MKMEIIRNLQIKKQIKLFVLMLVLAIGFSQSICQKNPKNFLPIQAIPYTEPIDSNNVSITISKNASGISQHSRLEFVVNVNNSLSESVYNINVTTNQTSSYISLSPSTTPQITIPELTPGESTDLQFVAEIEGEVTNPAVDLLLIIDASGSMGNEIDSVKEKITSLTDTLPVEIPGLKIGLIIYGWIQYSEYPTSHIGNQLPFTSNFDSVKNYINGLFAEGGKEPWGDALYLANSLEWRNQSQKLIIMVGDEDCDPGRIVGVGDTSGYYNGSQLLNEVQYLKDKGVIINTVVSDDPDENVEDQFKWISEFTGGKSVFLPEMQSEGIDLPDLIEEWTLELGREFSNEFSVVITWEDNFGNSYLNSGTETFWLDLTFPSIIVSENVKTTGINQYSVEILVKVSDFSPIIFVNLYHTGTGTWGFKPMNPLPNNSIYLAEIEHLSGGYNLSYYIEASDVLKNVGKTISYWIIVETPKLEIGQEITIWAQANDSIFSEIAFTQNLVHYLFLNGPEDIDSILVNIAYPGDTNQIPIASEYSQNISSKVWRKIFAIEFTSGTHTLNITIKENKGNFSFSYVWLTLVNMGNTTDESFTGEMTEKIRVEGLQWYGENESYFNMVLESQSPLVTLGEVYTTNWKFLGQFSAVSSFNITENTTYYLIIWATLRTGEYTISLDYESLITGDRYYDPENMRPYGRGRKSTPGFSVYFFVLSFFCLYFLRKSSNRKKG